MEALILICLMIVIVLLVKDKIIFKKAAPKHEQLPRVNPNLPHIMGQPKSVRRLSVTNSASESQKEDIELETDNFDTEIDQDDFEIQILQEELDEDFGNVPDFEDEEEELSSYRDTSGDESFGLALGVTFEELSAMGMMRQQEVLEPSLQQRAVKIVLKTQGTELFTLLENSIENASQKIAQLLDKNFSTEKDSGSSFMRNNDFEEFDIGEFV